MKQNKGTENQAFFSLHGRLFILLIVVILPFIIFSVYKAVDIEKDLEQEYIHESISTAKSVAHDIDEYVIATGDVLVPVAHNKDVRTQNFAAVRPWLQSFVPKYPYYHVLAFVDTKGYVKTVGMSDIMMHSEDAKKINVKDTACFTRGIVSNGISVGDFMYSKLTGIPVLHVTYPVFDYNNKRIGFVAMAFNLTKLQNKLNSANIPKHTLISVIDNKGIIIARSIEPKKFVGKSLAGTRRFEEMLGKKEGVSTDTYADGVTRLVGFAATSQVPWHVRVGVDEEYIHSQVRQELINHFTVFVPLLLLAIFGWLWIGRDVDKLHKKTEQLTLIDPLTGLWNCRKLAMDFKRELARAKRHREELSFCMIDIDHFKSYNDRNGHQLGDEALFEVAKVICDAVREFDTVYRYGGEEICVLLPNTDKENAALVAERIRLDVQDTAFEGEEHQPSGDLTISIGIATYPYDSISKEGLIKSADVALYAAKDSGRNRVVLYGEDSINAARVKGRYRESCI